MRVLNISHLKYNDSHNYYGGAIGNIAYSQLAELARIEGVTVESFTAGTDLERDPPPDLRFVASNSHRETKRRLGDGDRLDRASVVTHLYFHEPEYNPVSKLVSERGLPFVIGMCEVPHPRLGDEVSGVERLPLVRPIGRSLLGPLFRRTLRRADRLVVVDRNAKEYYGQWFPTERIDVIPYGVDPGRFAPTPAPESFRILMVNRLIERRGVDHMMVALPEVVDHVPGAELHVVGEGPRRDRLERAAAEVDVRDAVRFHGNVGPDELVRRYRECSAFVHLSFADGWNQPALEAMASGRPVVCTDEPHNSMVEDGETGFKIPWDAPGEVADRLVQLANDPALADDMGRRARSVVEERYLWDRIAREYHDVLEAVSTE
jgi:glycosyltransferase involved in cell wall biosynthesis